MKNFTYLKFLFLIALPCFSQINSNDSVIIQSVLDLNGVSSKGVSDISIADGNQRVVSLNLENLGIDTLPSEIGQLEFLVEFKINDNNLTNFPIEIKNLKNLLICDIGVCLGLVGLVVDNNKLCNLSIELQNWLDTTYFYAYQGTDWRDSQDCNSKIITENKKNHLMNNLELVKLGPNSIRIIVNEKLFSIGDNIFISDLKGYKIIGNKTINENYLDIEFFKKIDSPIFIHFEEQNLTIRLGL